MNLPDDVANQALDAIGCEAIGNLEEGTSSAQVLLRAYNQCLRQLLRAAHWDFARQTSPLMMLADATGNTPAVGRLVPTNWTYEYAYPNDCMKARFIPWDYQSAMTSVPTGNIAIPATPIMTGMGQAPVMMRPLRPAPFVIATDPNYPPPGGQVSWDTQGVSPEGRTVILTNVKNAQLVYTALRLYPSVWDACFRAAFVAYLASEVALPLWAKKDRKFGLQMRNDQIKIAQQKVIQARLSDGNEAFASVNLSVDWMNARSSGFGANAMGWGAMNGCYSGWDQLSFADGNVF